MENANLNSTNSELTNDVFVKDKKEKQKFSFLAFLQKIGKSLVFPIAVMPAAALFLRIGDAIASSGNVDGSTWEVVVYWFGWILRTPGSIVIDNLPIMFGLGVSFGLAKDHRGEAALVGLIGYLGIVALVQNEGSLTSLIYGNAMTTTIVDPITGATESYSQILYLVTTWTDPAGSGAIYGQATWLMNLGVFGGIGAGMLSAFLYNKYSDIQLPKALGFFSGRRFVPIVMLGSIVVVSFVVAVIWPWFQYGLVLLAQGLLFSPSIGSGLYVFANRLLIPTGLHQVLNVFLWFQMPILVNGNQVFIQVDGAFEPLLGDINAFLSSTSSITIMVDGITYTAATGAYELLQQAHVGAFQTGFFPVMMFGLPAVGFAIAYNADKEYRKATFAIMGSTALVSFITGITEPLEFSFMFISPILYFAYAALSGIVAAITVATGASIGFGFSAGAIDFGLSAQISSELSQGISSYANGYGGIINVLIIGILSFPVYFFMTHFMIKGFDLSTPGRKGNLTGLSTKDDDQISGGSVNKQDKYFNMAIDTIKLTGKDNLTDIDNCITRVRLSVKDNSHVEQKDATNIGYTGMFKPGKNAIQFVIGPESEVIAKYMKEIISNFDEYKNYFNDKNNESLVVEKQENIIVNNDQQKVMIKKIIKDDGFYNETTVKQIKQILDANHIRHKSNARKNELRELLKIIK